MFKKSAAPSAGYNLTNSLRFRSSASAYLNRTPSNGNKQIFTWSGWVKRGIFGTQSELFVADINSAYGGFHFQFDTNNKLYVYQLSASASEFLLVTSAVYRDPSAWYHIVLSIDTTNATADNRVRLYVNGSQITAFDSRTNPTINLDTYVNNSSYINYLGTGRTAIEGLRGYFDGYMAEVNFIDGQALTPSSFGETSTSTGVWIPKKYTGTYGTNGFYLPFTDNSGATSTTIGKDFSGNGNNWTPNNISVTAGSTYDSMTDVPTLTSATAANYCVLNPLVPVYANSISYANMRFSNSQASTWATANSTLGVSSGKWYWEATITTLGGAAIIGISNSDTIHGSTALGQLSNDYAYLWNGNKQGNAGSATSYGATYTTGNVIGVALDMDAGTLTFYKDNSSQGTAFTGLSNSSFVPAVSNFNSGVIDINFGQRPFAYTPPTGFVALNTFNLPTPTIGATASTQAITYMGATTYSGDSTSNRVITTGGGSDFVWIKRRNSTTNHILFDVLRGAGATLYSNLTNAEAANGSYYVQTFGNTSFTLGTGGDAADNITGGTYVAWNWKANGAGVTNTAGSITSTVSANTSAGFSVVTYTGNGTGGATIGHGLGVAPSMIILKRRNGTSNWTVGHSSLTSWAYYLVLNLTDAQASNNVVWNSTAPTSSVFTVGTGADQNGSGNTIVAYCFAQIAGYSAFGSYTGNGSTDGPFVFTGFRPRFVLIKCSSGSGAGWLIYDSARNTYNLVDLFLQANQSNAEAGNSTDNPLDFLSNGFKLRYSNTATNQSNETFIYMAFAENPFKYANAR